MLGVIGCIMVWSSNPRDPDYFNYAIPLGMVLLSAAVLAQAPMWSVLGAGGMSGLAFVSIMMASTEGTWLAVLLSGLIAAGVFAPLLPIFRHNRPSSSTATINPATQHAEGSDASPATTPPARRSPPITRIASIVVLTIAALIVAGGVGLSIRDIHRCDGDILCGVDGFLTAIVAVPVAMIGLALVIMRPKRNW